MSVVGHAPPPFFKRGPAPLVRLVFFVSLSLILLVADLRFHTLEWVRLAVATAAWPMQRATGVPIDVAGDVGAYLARQSTLLQAEEEPRAAAQLDDGQSPAAPASISSRRTCACARCSTCARGNRSKAALPKFCTPPAIPSRGG